MITILVFLLPQYFKYIEFNDHGEYAGPQVIAIADNMFNNSYFLKINMTFSNEVMIHIITTVVVFIL